MTTRLLLVLAFLAAAGCGGSHGSGAPDASHPCGVFGTACTSGDTCCSGICDNTGSCTVNTTTCSMAGASCSANTDCCTDSCVNFVCSDTQCTGDNGSCGGSGECCSGNCANGTCAPLNATCKTAGNACGGGAECCSKYCDPNGKCGDSSWCVQDGDACAHDAECCGGICTPSANGGTLGTCTHPMPGSTLCSAGVDGTVCSGCGDCCSRLCEVYGPTGVKVCQPAEGCRVNGDTCHQTSDCCGAAGTGLPGDGHVECLKEHPNDTVGICRNPMACNPEGDVCHYQNYQTCGNSSARNDCCGDTGNQQGMCKLDALGVPRCYGIGACRMAGQTCAFAGDCCNGAPCVPDNTGTLHCGGSTCVNMGGACTNDADCCNGTTCVFTAGQTYGTCGGMSTCAQYGQACTQTSDCCNGTPCQYVDTNGNFQACVAGQMCTCSTQIL